MTKKELRQARKAEKKRLKELKKEAKHLGITVEELEQQRATKKNHQVVQKVTVEESHADDSDDEGLETPEDLAKPTKAVKYHVSQNKDANSPHFKKWRVRREGSKKTIKYFTTQKDAIEYATELANRAGSSIVIHKLDGSIRRQDYTKK